MATPELPSWTGNEDSILIHEYQIKCKNPKLAHKKSISNQYLLLFFYNYLTDSKIYTLKEKANHSKKRKDGRKKGRKEERAGGKTSNPLEKTV